MSPPALAVLAVVAGAAGAALYWPLVGLLAYLWMDFMRPHDSWVELRRLRPMLVLAAVTVAATVWHGRRELPAWDGRLLPLLAVAIAAALSLTVSIAPTESALALVHLGKMLVLVWLLERLARQEAALRAVLWVVAGSVGVLGVGAIAEATARGIWTDFVPGFVVEGPYGFGEAPFRDNNNLARVLALTLPLWWALAALRGPSWSRLLAAVGAAAAVVAIIATFSRSGFVALLAGSAAIASFYRPYWRAALGWLGFVGVVLLLTPAPYGNRVGTIAGTPDASVQGRLDVWRDGGSRLQRNPVLGQGAGTFTVRQAGEPPRRSSHNIFVEAAVEIGLVGLAAYLWLLGATLLRLYRLRQRPPDDWRRIAAAGVLAALLAYLVAGLALSDPFAPPLFVLIGLSLALDRAAPATARAAMG